MILNIMAKEKDFYTAQELADSLRVNVMTIYRYIKAGRLKAYKFGKEFRIETREFESFLASHKTQKSVCLLGSAC